MATVLKAGVIGLGIMGRQHAEALHGDAGVELAAVADVRARLAEDVGAQLGARPYADYREMLRDASLDLVVVATPDPLHREPIVDAIRAGTPNVIQEKPFATTMADAEAIYDEVERAGARLFVNFANRASALDIATRYVLREGLLGKVVYGDMRLDDHISVPTQMWGERTRQWAGSSSVAHFLLSHVVDLLRWHFSPAEVTDVYAVSQTEVLGYTPDVFDAFLTFDSGLKMRVKSEWIKHIDALVEFYIEFSGSEGTLIYNRRPGFGVEACWRANLSTRVGSDELMAHRRELMTRGIEVTALVHQPDRTSGRLPGGEPETRVALERRTHPASIGMPLVAHMVNAILEDHAEPSPWRGNGPLPSHVDGLRQTRVVTAIMESAETGEPVSLETG